MSPVVVASWIFSALWMLAAMLCEFTGDHDGAVTRQALSLLWAILACVWKRRA